MVTSDDGQRIRIGELGRRVGLKPELLRAWERRYGVLRPARTGGGLRLYSAADEHRVGVMQAHIANGLSPAEAARLALAEESGAAADPGGRPWSTTRPGSIDALDSFDADEGQRGP